MNTTFPSTGEYNFTRAECDSLYKIITSTGSALDGFKSYWNLGAEGGSIATEAVEDFAIAFFTAYNRFVPGTF